MGSVPRAKALSISALVVIATSAGCAREMGEFEEIGEAQSGSIVSPLEGTNLRALSANDVPPVVERVSGKDLVPHFIKDRGAAVKLGKALFYDMSAGSDGQACASCHFNAGMDTRVKNQLNPGGTEFDPTASGGAGGPNYRVTAADFPFHKLADPSDRDSAVLFDSDDRMSSQGVFPSFFVDVQEGEGNDVCDRDPVDPAKGDPEGFHVGGINVRRVEPRNTPTVINAVFNFRNFWDVRANNIFNGEDPFGRRSKDARILVKYMGGYVEKERVEFENSSLASQAVGPIGSPFEMACAGRLIPHAGKKLISLKPLDSQLVSATDSVLGDLSCQDSGNGCAQPQGLATTYEDLIKEAFADRLWDSSKRFDAEKNEHPDGRFSMMEANFSLFWGLAIQEYESTLISHKTRFDDYAAYGTPLSSSEMRGLDLFVNQGRCVACHDTAMFSKASTQHLIDENQEEGLVERMLMGREKHLFSLRGKGTVERRYGKTVDIQINAAASPDAVGEEATGDKVSGTMRLVFKRGPTTCTKRKRKRRPVQCDYEIKSYTMDRDGDPYTRDVHLKAKRKTRWWRCPRKIRMTVLDHLDDKGPDGKPDRVKLRARWKSFDKPLAKGSFRHLGPALYDNGTYNIGVRKTKEDGGLGGKDPFGNPLSFTRQYLDMLQGKDVPDPFEIDECKFEVRFDPTVDIFDFPGGFDPVDCEDGTTAYRPKNNAANKKALKHARVAVDGAFKVPTLRNIELTGPGFHNGGQANLEQVVEFYNRGGDFAKENRPDTDPDIRPLGLDAQDRADLVAFMKTLTDERVRCKKAPFDHPQLFVPNGHPGDEYAVTDDLPERPGQATDELVEIPAVGAEGHPLGSCLEEFSP